MAKRKMASWMRDKLKGHAAKVVFPAAHQKVMDAAYRKAAPLVRAVVQARYPQRDMKVLKRYGVSETMRAPMLQMLDGSMVRFVFHKDDAPLRSIYYSSDVFLADEALAAAANAWVDASKTYHDERKVRLAAYGALIDGSTYVDDLIETWPEAAGVIPLNALPIPLGPEQVALVKRDQKERKAA